MSESNTEQTTVTFGATLTGNEYTESAWEEIDVSELDNAEIDFLAEILGWESEPLRALSQVDRKPCRSCGTPMPAEHPPVCEVCRRSEEPASEREEHSPSYGRQQGGTGMRDEGIDRSGSSIERLDGSQYGDPEDHRPAHVAPPDGEEPDQDSEAVLDLRVLGIDVEGEEAHEIANAVNSVLSEERDIEGVAPVLHDDAELVIDDSREGPNA
ncbi:hypothetical protein [Halorhabdus tiamatea]|nr:hypothetical protein [Halorhabdus tiamatea]